MRRIAILTLVAVASFPQLARSDGFDRSYKDGPSVNYYSNAPTSYREEPRRHGLRRWLDDRDMALARCLKRNAERRQAGLRGRDCAAMSNVRKAHVATRYYREDPRPTRYAASRYPRYDAEERSDRHSCKAAIPVEGRIRGTRERALESAWNSWETSARARHGYAYGDRANARRLGNPECPTAGKNVFGKTTYICTVVARPCRD